ncbi:DUF362 domain-containing protein [Candidatus Pacearchaeota archaeon]|nr:DUF362 domain-containing protein [Candidatus Pacearchaeota archaeon]
MVKGVSIKFKSYADVPKLLDLIKLEKELKKHSKIVIKPSLKDENSQNTPVEFTEEVLRYCMANKNPAAEVFIAEGSDGNITMDLFDKEGYRKLAEKYSVGLIDLNHSEVEEIHDGEFMKFSNIMYPKILLDSFIISLPKLAEDPEMEMQGSLSNMIGAFPLSYYKGFFSSTKNKLRKWPLKYAVHDILRCKMPSLGIIDASSQGMIIAGQPLEIDKQAAKALGKDWKGVGYIRLVDDSFAHQLAAQAVKKEPSEKQE